jgi:hypothetical protein
MSSARGAARNRIEPSVRTVRPRSCTAWKQTQNVHGPPRPSCLCQTQSRRSGLDALMFRSRDALCSLLLVGVHDERKEPVSLNARRRSESGGVWRGSGAEPSSYHESRFFSFASFSYFSMVRASTCRRTPVTPNALTSLPSLPRQLRHVERTRSMATDNTEHKVRAKSTDLIRLVQDLPAEGRLARCAHRDARGQTCPHFARCVRFVRGVYHRRRGR